MFADAVELTAPTRSDLPCDDSTRVFAAVESLRPDVVVNAAAFTRVDDAERERDAATAMNSALPDVLAKACEAVGASLLQFSTDYVFSGAAHRPYREDDATGPVNFYGETKLRGEQAALRESSRVVVLRTSWIYSRRGTNFFRTMLRLAQERDEIRVVNDQCGSPTWAKEVAAAAAQLVLAFGRDRDAWADARGIYHVAARGATSWFEFAARVLAMDPARSAHRVRRLIPVPSVAYPTPANRPAYSVLDCALIEARFGIALPAWEAQLEQVWST